VKKTKGKKRKGIFFCWARRWSLGENGSVKFSRVGRDVSILRKTTTFHACIHVISVILVYYAVAFITTIFDASSTP
jgi:hypothetical protein